jgi:hypothetical protein
VLLLMCLPSGWAKPQHFVYLAAELSNDARAVGLAPSYQAADMVFTVAGVEIWSENICLTLFV